jgi:hypothetical protein
MIITLLRKPLDGSVAENALQHGCGAINIDATRVGTEARTYKGAGKTDKVYSESGAGMLDGRGKEMVFSVEGRWPANFILTHLEGCELRGTKKVKSDGNHTYKAPQDGGTIKLGLKDLPSKGNPHADEDGKEEVENWACVEGCPVKKLDTQTGILKSGGLNAEKSPQMQGVNRIFGSSKEMTATFGEEAGPSNFFMKFKKDPEE